MNDSVLRSSPTLRDRLQRLVESPAFDTSIVILIVANAVTLGLETSPSVTRSLGTFLHAFDRLALSVFVVELALRAFVYRSRFFHDAWRVFDLVIVGMALLPATGFLSVLRALRILRALRLLSMISSMRGVVAALLTALPGMASIIGLMTLVLYVSAVIATKLFGAIAPALFGTLGASLFTLFQVMTVEGWPDIARPIMERAPYAWIFFVIYLLIATFMVINLFIAVVVNAMQTQVAAEIRGEEEAHTKLILEEVRALRRELESLHGAARRGT